MNNAEWMDQNGYKVGDLQWSLTQPGSIIRFDLNGKNVGKVSMYPYFKALKIWLDAEHVESILDDVERRYLSAVIFFKALKIWLDAEHVEPILDDVERRYLSAVIRPFRDRVQYIAKSFDDDARFYRINCYIFIHFNDGSDDMDFPVFNESKMYKGMAINRPYTLKELGL